jgi:hypothetical protein
VPSAAGKRETMTLDIPAGKTLHIAIRAFDNSNNRGPMSPCVIVAANGGAELRP